MLTLQDQITGISALTPYTIGMCLYAKYNQITIEKITSL
jgi:hypothetical protein